jgi:hypothetical protein
MEGYPFLVLVPRAHADETTMGEWLEVRNADYVSMTHVPAVATTYEFHFASKKTADEFARNFVS